MTFALLIVSSILSVFIYILHKKLKASESELLELSKYRNIGDVEKYTQERKIEANKIVEEANAVLSKARSEREELIDKTNQECRELRSKNDTMIAGAAKTAREIIATAEAEAKKIAGNAYEAMKKADTYAKAAESFKNIIEGYGDRYLIPTHSLIDELADDYSHTDAGADLKKVRDKVKSMIKAKTASSCDYVEENRKVTAMDFVLDAFNGKVETILLSVKSDNYGTLEKKIKDAFDTVNYNGVAFRNARITDIYLSTRLDELKLACIVQALKEKDKEEQRRIRDQIREEEKAARDYEKAIRDAQKEEETLAKSMDKVRKELESASEKKREEYELKLKELEEKLRQAEEKNQRALSMAQQTKTGHVYVISNIGSFGEDVIKIGMTRRLDPMDRVYELGDASVPFDFDVHAMILSDDAPNLEKELHKKFCDTQLNKVNPRKEFFKITIGQLKQYLDEKGIHTHWTMAAEAKEYRETLSINKKAA